MVAANKTTKISIEALQEEIASLKMQLMKMSSLKRLSNSPLTSSPTRCSASLDYSPHHRSPHHRSPGNHLSGVHINISPKIRLSSKFSPKRVSSFHHNIRSDGSTSHQATKIKLTFDSAQYTGPDVNIDKNTSEDTASMQTTTYQSEIATSRSTDTSLSTAKAYNTPLRQNIIHLDDCSDIGHYEHVGENINDISISLTQHKRVMVAKNKEIADKDQALSMALAKLADRDAANLRLEALFEQEREKVCNNPSPQPIKDVTRVLGMCMKPMYPSIQNGTDVKKNDSSRYMNSPCKKRGLTMVTLFQESVNLRGELTAEKKEVEQLRIQVDIYAIDAMLLN